MSHHPHAHTTTHNHNILRDSHRGEGGQAPKRMDWSLRCEEASPDDFAPLPYATQCTRECKHECCGHIKALASALAYTSARTATDGPARFELHPIPLNPSPARGVIHAGRFDRGARHGMRSSSQCPLSTHSHAPKTPAYLQPKTDFTNALLTAHFTRY